jgi:hypothetical protein
VICRNDSVLAINSCAESYRLRDSKGAFNMTSSPICGWVFPADSVDLMPLMTNETPLEALGYEADDVKCELFDDHILFFSKTAYFDRKGQERNPCFDSQVRVSAPYAPEFRGTMVVISNPEVCDPSGLKDFIAAATQRWSVKSEPAEEIPDGLLAMFSKVQMQTVIKTDDE